MTMTLAARLALAVRDWRVLTGLVGSGDVSAVSVEVARSRSKRRPRRNPPVPAIEAQWCFWGSGAKAPCIQPGGAANPRSSPGD